SRPPSAYSSGKQHPLSPSDRHGTRHGEERKRACLHWPHALRRTRAGRSRQRRSSRSRGQGDQPAIPQKTLMICHPERSEGPAFLSVQGNSTSFPFGCAQGQDDKIWRPTDSYVELLQNSYNSPPAFLKQSICCCGFIMSDFSAIIQG